MNSSKQAFETYLGKKKQQKQKKALIFLVTEQRKEGILAGLTSSTLGQQSSTHL